MNWLASAASCTLAPLFVGYYLARQSSGREIAVALANVTFSSVFVLLGLLISTKNFQLGGGSVPLHLISDLFLLTGAILCRFRWLGLQRQAKQQNEPATA